jgi:hypothetical protein
LTKSEPVVVYITGFGPSDPIYVKAADNSLQNRKHP